MLRKESVWMALRLLVKDACKGRQNCLGNRVLSESTIRCIHFGISFAVLKVLVGCVTFVLLSALHWYKGLMGRPFDGTSNFQSFHPSILNKYTYSI